MSEYNPPYVGYRSLRRPVPERAYKEYEYDLPPSPSPSNERKVRRMKRQQNSDEVPTTKRWSTRKKVIVGVIIGSAIAAAITLTVVLAVVLTRSNTTTTSTASTPVVSVYWSFDNTTAEASGVYSGQLVNGATYGASNSTMPYVGQGQALSLTAASNQSFQVTSAFLNLTYRSFTIEAWIYSSNYTGDRGIFGQCQCSTCAHQCFYFLVRAARLYAGFTLNDVSGLQTLAVNTWFHVAFVYDYAAQQQLLYLNGILDNVASNANPYQGGNATISIGSTLIFSAVNFFTGQIDNLRIVTRAKSAAEILTDASLIAYYSFDLPAPNNDNGPNGLNGSSVNTAIVTGRVNQAMRFTGASSYFQAYGFYQLGFGVNFNRPFSISMWINPASTNPCVIIQQSTSASNGSCTNMLGLWTYTGQTAQLVAQGYAWPTIYGPFITTNTWIHISWTFSLARGYFLYVNGNVFGGTGYYSYGGSSWAITWLQVGYNFACSSAYISNSPYQGIIDELYLHNRELSAAEVLNLANP